VLHLYFCSVYIYNLICMLLLVNAVPALRGVGGGHLDKKVDKKGLKSDS